jgi:RNA polymerase sigma-70 factor, ECF subfamily
MFKNPKTHSENENLVDARRPLSRVDESSLISEICHGCRDQFAALIEPHRGVLQSVIKRAVFDQFEAEDLVQQTLMKAYLNLPTFRRDSTFRTWLLAIALNEVRQYKRQGRHRHAVTDLDPFLSIIPAAGSFVDDLERRELAHLVRETVAMLPRKYRTIIELQVFQGLSIADTAHKLTLSVNGVKTRYLRARRQMAVLIKNRSRHTSLFPSQSRERALFSGAETQCAKNFAATPAHSYLRTV